jgi:hypothetical protein
VWGASALVCDIGAFEVAPSSDFQIAPKVKCKNRRCRAIVATITLPGPGSLTAKDAHAAAPARSAKSSASKLLVKPASTTSAQSGAVTLKLALTRTAIKKLRKKHKIRPAISFTFSPVGGTPAGKTQTFKVKLKKKRRHR